MTNQDEKRNYHGPKRLLVAIVNAAIIVTSAPVAHGKPTTCVKSSAMRISYIMLGIFLPEIPPEESVCRHCFHISTTLTLLLFLLFGDIYFFSITILPYLIFLRAFFGHPQKLLQNSIAACWIVTQFDFRTVDCMSHCFYFYRNDNKNNRKHQGEIDKTLAGYLSLPNDPMQLQL